MRKWIFLIAIFMSMNQSAENEARAQGFQAVAGVDEAGRGPWAGPVVAAAVVLPANFSCDSLNDSKKLSRSRRQSAEQILLTDGRVHFAIGIASVLEIDEVNVLQATLRAMRRALMQLPLPADYVLVDGRDFPFAPLPGRAVIRGDAKIASIAAASILAKEHRDGIMRQLAQEYPHYGFDSHQGYGTARHHAALQKYGPCAAHRRSFAPVRALV